jgi:hypothetical protein
MRNLYRGLITATVTVAAMTAVTPAFAHSDSSVSNANTTGSSGGGAAAKYYWSGDLINRCDTKGDGFSVYANYQYPGVSSSTPQYNGGNGNCGTFDLGTLTAGWNVSVRAAVQVDGGANKYGSWVSGIA